MESSITHTQPVVTVEPASTDKATASNTTTIEERTPTVPLDEVLAFPDIHPSAHEFVALLQASTSYELVDWLAKRLQFAVEQLA